MTIQTRLQGIQQKIAAARAKSPHGQTVELIAVSKTYAAEVVRAAVAAGHHAFGENRVQEAMGKFPALRAAFPDLKLHLIGPLQTNKTRDAVATFDCIHTVDRAALADKLANEMAKQGRHVPCLIQVNTGAEPQKAGVMSGELAGLLAFCKTNAPLNIQGLMCIPPVDAPPERHFQLLADLAAEHHLPLLSMGMSADYEIAIAHGATHVRVGSALFGARA